MAERVGHHGLGDQAAVRGRVTGPGRRAAGVGGRGEAAVAVIAVGGGHLVDRGRPGPGVQLFGTDDVTGGWCRREGRLTGVAVIERTGALEHGVRCGGCRGGGAGTGQRLALCHRVDHPGGVVAGVGGAGAGLVAVDRLVADVVDGHREPVAVEGGGGSGGTETTGGERGAHPGGGGVDVPGVGGDPIAGTAGRWPARPRVGHGGADLGSVRTIERDLLAEEALEGLLVDDRPAPRVGYRDGSGTGR
jgi:hypothetical protein